MGSCVHQSEQGFVGDPPVLEGITHVVAEGETLVGIARAYGITPQRIQRINRIHDPNQLEVGQRLHIPGATERKSAVTVKAAAPEEKGVYHVVKPGETLKRISDAYEVEAQAIERYNNIHDPRKLQIGQKLFIPGVDEIKEVRMSVAEKVYHKTPQGSREERIALAKRIEKLVDRHRVEKGEPPLSTPTPTPTPEPGVATPTPTPEATAVPAPQNIQPPAEVKKVDSLVFSWPLTGDFVVAKQYGAENGLMGNGMILTAGTGSPVLAAADGEVQMVGGVSDDFGNTLGNYVILYHGKRKGKGLRTIYAHASEVVVKAGDKVSRGQMIARVGQTGRVPKDIQTDHLHFEVREATNPINPIKLLPERK